MARFFRTGVILAALLFSLSAFALELQEAKSRGLVGEQPNGYLGVVGQPNSEINSLVEDINSRRQAAYKDIAAKNNTSLEAVEQIAGKKAIQKSASGHYVNIDGHWTQVP